MSALFVNHITVLDFSYVDPQRGILGESWIVDVVLHGDLDEQGMVFDFGQVKNRVKDAVEDLFDHKLVIPTQGLADLTQETLANGDVEFRWRDAEGRRYRHRSHTQAFYAVAAEQLSIEAMEPLLAQAALAAVPGNVSAIDIRLRTEDINGPYYHYSHGLRKHLGNCQRIAHGHRSRIQIARNGKRDPLLEKAWALKWQDVYLASEQDVSELPAEDNHEYLDIGYDAEQGRFELTIPKDKAYVIATDTTVELLAEHIAQELKAEAPDQEFEVRAFEGVRKGSLTRL